MPQTGELEEVSIWWLAGQDLANGEQLQPQCLQAFDELVHVVALKSTAQHEMDHNGKTSTFVHPHDLEEPKHHLRHDHHEGCHPPPCPNLPHPLQPVDRLPQLPAFVVAGIPGTGR